MIQEIITYIILLTTVGIAGYRIFQALRPLIDKKHQQTGSSCAGCSTECSLKDIKGQATCGTHSIKTKSYLTTL